MKFEVDTNQLASTVQKMYDTLNDIRMAKTRMYQALESLDGMWEGVAHDTFKAQYISDDQILTNLSNTIESVIESNDAAKTAYETCEQSVLDQINRISI